MTLKEMREARKNLQAESLSNPHRLLAHVRGRLGIVIFVF